jgi:hypothetical protein
LAETIQLLQQLQVGYNAKPNTVENPIQGSVLEPIISQS